MENSLPSAAKYFLESTLDSMTGGDLVLARRSLKFATSAIEEIEREDIQMDPQLEADLISCSLQILDQFSREIQYIYFPGIQEGISLLGMFPFAFLELHQILLEMESKQAIRLGNYLLSIPERLLRKENEIIVRFTEKEQRLFLFLLERKNQLTPRNEIFGSTDSICTTRGDMQWYTTSLSNKLSATNGDIRLETVPWKGFILHVN